MGVAAAPIAADCLTTFHATRSSGVRRTSEIRWIVMHDAEAKSAEGVARFFASPGATGSAHLVVDDVACYRTLLNEAVPWGAPGANTHGFHIEQCGFARWSAVVWTSHLATLNRAAYKAAFHCVKFGIPVRFVDAAGLKAKRAGITTHAECTRAFGGNHTDPGLFWPRRLFMLRVAAYHRALVAAGV